MDRVNSETIQAYASGIVEGSCGPDFIFEFTYLPISDDHFRVILGALTTKSHCKTGCPEGLTFKFPVSELTDNSLAALAKAIKHDRFPDKVKIDLSSANRFTDAGARMLLEALAEETCNLSVDIKLPMRRSLINQDLVQQINQRLQENHHHYRPKKALETKKEKTPKKTKDEQAVKGVTSPRKSIFKAKFKTKTRKDAGEKKVYTRHEP